MKQKEEVFENMEEKIMKSLTKTFNQSIKGSPIPTMKKSFKFENIEFKG